MPTGNPGAQVLDPARAGGPPPLEGGPKVFPANFFGQKLEVDVERIGFSAAKAAEKFLRPFFDQKKNMQGNFNQNRGVGWGTPPLPTKRGPQIESIPRSAIFPLPKWAAKLADLGRDPDPGRKLSVLLVGKNDQSKSKKRTNWRNYPPPKLA